MTLAKTTLSFFSFLALAIVVVASTGGASPAAAASVTHFGIDWSGDPNQAFPVARALGVHYMRVHAVNTGNNADQIARIKQFTDAGYEVSCALANSTGISGDHSGPVLDDALYTAQVASFLDRTKCSLLQIQTEEDGGAFDSATPAQYLHQLALAVAVAKARGIPVTNGALTTSGLLVAYWHHLWMAKRYADADAFAKVAFSSGKGTLETGWLPDFPTAVDPMVGGPDGTARFKPPHIGRLKTIEVLIAGEAQTGIVCQNVNWTQVDNAAFGKVLTWLKRVTGIPPCSTAMSQVDSDPATMIDRLNVMASMGAPWVLWFAAAHFDPVTHAINGNASGLTDWTYRLNPSGEAFRDYIASK